MAIYFIVLAGIMLAIIVLIPFIKPVSILKRAIKNGNTNKISHIIQANINIETKFKQGVTPLLLASNFGQIASVKKLLELGANIEEKNEDNETALFIAANKGYSDLVSLLVDWEASLEHIGDCNTTPLLAAATNGYLDSLKHLVEGGANLEARDEEGWTALMIASEQHQEIVEYLIKQNVNIESKGTEVEFELSGDGLNKIIVDKEITALMIASKEGKKFIVQLLIDSGADVKAKSQSGRTYLDF
jgi:ankyrin repeat protein